MACFSCRAFWRRCHLNSKIIEMTCKKLGSCKITLKNRKKCKKCRYQRCKESGMTQDAILDDDQKKQRFRKMIQKRKCVSVMEESQQIGVSSFSTRSSMHWGFRYNVCESLISGSKCLCVENSAAFYGKNIKTRDILNFCGFFPPL